MDKTAQLGRMLYDKLHAKQAESNFKGDVALSIPEAEVVLEVKVANTQAEAEVGMAAYNNLPNDKGMLFKTANAFWMKDVQFPLDILFMDKQGSITDIQHMKKDPAGTCIYTPRIKSATALEVPGGYALRNQIQRGMKVVVVDER